MYRTERILEETSIINYNESCSNLNLIVDFIKEVKANDYCDHTSFNNISNRIETCKLDLVNNKIHQIKLIENLSINILNVRYDQYLDHSVVVEPYTLIFIDGGFNNNETVPYPIINNYNWNGVVIPYDNLNQNNGNYSININGVQFQNLPNEIGYKWLGLEYDVLADTIVESQVRILDLNEKLSSLGFNDNIISVLRQSYNPAFPFNDNTAIIGFITITIRLSIIIFPGDTIDKIKQSYNLTDEDIMPLLIDNLFEEDLLQEELGDRPFDGRRPLTRDLFIKRVGSLNNFLNQQISWYDMIANVSASEILNNQYYGSKFLGSNNRFGPVIPLNAFNKINLIIGLNNNKIF